MFNFHTAGLFVCSSTLAHTHESSEPPGSSSTTTVCISWNKGCCKARLHLAVPHHATVCTRSTSRDTNADHNHRGCGPHGSGSSFIFIHLFPTCTLFCCGAPIMCTLNSTSIGLSSCYVLVFACYPDFTVQGGPPGLFEFYSLL